MATGWPPDSDLADRLALMPGDDAARVSSANAAGQAAATRLGVPWDTGPPDAEIYEAVLMLGQWVYESRNRPEGLDSLNPVATPYYRRTAEGIILAHYGLPIA